MSPLHLLHATGLSSAPQVILLRLHTADLSGAPPTSIMRSTGLSKSAVSMALRSLEASGLVERRFLSRDKRSAMLYLTPKGMCKAIAMQDAIEAFSDDVKKRVNRDHPKAVPVG